MSSTAFNITTTKQKLTRKLNILQKLIEDSNQYRPEWEFPSDNSELELFVLTNQISVTKLRQQLDEQTEQTWTLYESSIQAIATMEEDKTLEETFNDYWEEKQGDKTISIATLLSQQLYKRLIELECQAAAFDLSQTNSVDQGNNNSKETNQESLIQLFNSLMIDQELFIGDIKLPEFHGNPSEFGPFWELFQELVHEQPFSNIRKLSILLSCCKGDAARCLQMIPRTADSYEKAIEQLKDQYEDPRRITIQMIRQLTSMKPCNNDPRSLRNNLNDIKAIIATLQKQGEIMDNSYMVTLVTETFPKPIQEEIASKQFDSGCQWTMEDLLVNLTTIIKRREFIESRNENPNEEHSVFHTRTRDQRVPYCIGCERAHAFENCDKYRTIPQMIGRLKSLGACWKCFDSRHKTKYCHMPDCANCGGHHNPILCQRESAKSQSTFQPPFQGQSSIPDTRERRWSHSTLPHTVMWRHHRPERNSQEDNNMQRPSRYLRRSSLFPRRRRQNVTKRSVSDSPSEVANYDIPIQSPNRVQNGSPPLSNYGTDSNPRTGATSSSRQTHHYNKALATKNINTAYVNFQLNLLSHPDTEVEFIDGITSNARLMVVPLKVQNKYINKREQVYALLDSASDQSFISSSLLERLHLIPRSEISITINTFGGHAEKKHVKRVEALLLNLQEQPLEVTLLTTNTISHAIPLLELNEEDKFFLKCNFTNLQEYWLHDATTEVVPDILLGMDYFNIILRTGEPLVQLPSGLHMTPTFFGHIICGAPHNKNTKIKPLSDKVKNVNHTKCTNTNHSQCTYNQPNFGYSNLQKLLNTDNEVLHTNDAAKRQVIADSNSTKAPYYMPHQTLIQTSCTTTNTKIVHDGFYKMSRQPRLNDRIHKKPPLLPNLCNILSKAKLNSKIMTAGMQKGSHFNSLQISEHDSVQFLRLMVAKQPPIPNNIRIFRFCRLPFDIKASPLLLGTPIHHRKEQEKEQNEPSLPASQLTLWKYWLTMAPTLTPIQATCPLSRHGPHLQFLTREINWQSLQQSERMQVYGIEYCIEKHEPDHKITAQLPFEVKLHTFHFTLKSVIRKVKEAKFWVAPSSRNHDQMKCNFRIKIGSNPKCRLRKASNVTALSIYAIVLTAYITSKVTCKSFKTSTKLHQISTVHRREKRIRGGQGDLGPLREVGKFDKKWNKATITQLNTNLIHITSTTDGCQEPIPPPAKLVQCEDYARKSRNQTMLVTQFKLMPPGMCIQLQHNDQEFHTMHTPLKTRELPCHEEILHLTANIQQRFSFSPIPILHQRFRTDKRRTAAVHQDAQISYSCTATNQTINKTRNCKMNNSCECSLTENYCTNDNVSPSEQLSLTPLLPIFRSLVNTEKLNNIPIRPTEQSLKLLLSADPLNKNIVQELKNFQCHIPLKRLLGYSKCFEKLQATIFFQSNSKNPIAQRNYIQQQITTNCIQLSQCNHIPFLTKLKSTKFAQKDMVPTQQRSNFKDTKLHKSSESSVNNQLNLETTNKLLN